MIDFIQIKPSDPILRFKEEYDKASILKQDNIEAICISSYNLDSQEISSRFVNLKYVNGDKFHFFSNYNSPKGIDFENNNKISVCIFWHKTNVQIRMKAKINKISKKESDYYFDSRDNDKNALAISSMQSKPIETYQKVINNYEKVSADVENLSRPDYWGGYSFIPYYYEFWEGKSKRINKRESYAFEEKKWLKNILQP
tara:strand:+ start:107 stop:703 length:597 start_codon:yes stop_codon:yes gene_type:complete